MFNWGQSILQTLNLHVSTSDAGWNSVKQNTLVLCWLVMSISWNIECDAKILQIAATECKEWDVDLNNTFTSPMFVCHPTCVMSVTISIQQSLLVNWMGTRRRLILWWSSLTPVVTMGLQDGQQIVCTGNHQSSFSNNGLVVHENWS